MNRRLNRLWLIGGAAALFAACAPLADEETALVLDLGDLEDYAEWYEYERENEPDPDPFEADPLVVTALGKVRAVPDVAVITATLAFEDENESRAVDRVSRQVNAVQAALDASAADGLQVETGFTALRSRPDYDQACLNENRAAQRRYSEIYNDYWFNRRLDEAGDTETRRRPPRPRLEQRVCQAQAVRISTDMVVRISPAEAAGDVLRALGEAGAERARLHGYDFSNYDALYQQAAAAAVSQARGKAEAVARGAGGELGEIVEMSVSRPARLGRFGPQPTVIRPPRPRSGDGMTALDSYANGRFSEEPAGYYAPAAPMSDFGEGDEIVVTGSRLANAAPPPVTVADVVSSDRSMGQSAGLVRQPASAMERMRPDGTTELLARSVGTNALTMSLMSGPQTIEVAARLSYAYPTPLDGIVIKPAEDD